MKSLTAEIKQMSDEHKMSMMRIQELKQINKVKASDAALLKKAIGQNSNVILNLHKDIEAKRNALDAERVILREKEELR